MLTVKVVAGSRHIVFASSVTEHTGLLLVSGGNCSRPATRFAAVRASVPAGKRYSGTTQAAENRFERLPYCLGDHHTQWQEKSTCLKLLPTQAIVAHLESSAHAGNHGLYWRAPDLQSNILPPQIREHSTSRRLARIICPHGLIWAYSTSTRLWLDPLAVAIGYTTNSLGIAMSSIPTQCW